MPSQLVDEVRRLIRDREEAGRPLTSLERTFIEAAIVPRRNTPDLVDELEGALAQARTYLLTDPPAGVDPQAVRQARQRATRRLIAAARAVLDHDPALEALEPDTPLPELDPDRRLRADVDG
jgi:hypothetical protein